MKVGYMRVSKHEQHKALQEDALAKAGCEKTFCDEGVTGTRFDRKGLLEALEFLRAGDVLVVWKFDRAGRSLEHLIDLINGLKSRDVGFISLTENIDTTTPGGMLIFHIMGALAEFEHALIVERVTAGLEAALARGRKGGRKPKLTEKEEQRVVSLHQSRQYTIDEIGGMVGNGKQISRSTVTRIIARHRQAAAPDETTQQAG